METGRRIVLLVALQVALILASFFAIGYLESQTALTGNIVNVSGKNRHLTS